jgi:uncharacterized protein (TIGR03083 family)
VHSPVPADVLDRLESALATTGALVADIAPSQWRAPTPCPDWDVRMLTNHLVGGLRIFAARLTDIEAAVSTRTTGSARTPSPPTVPPPTPSWPPGAHPAP